jgi:chromosome segregation ATPase
LVRVKFTYQAAQRKLEEQGTLLNKTRRDLKKQRELIDKLEESVSRLQDKLEEATPQTGVLEEYEKKLHEATEEKRMHSDSYQLAVTAIDEKNAEQRDLKVEMDVLDSNISIIKKKVSQAETEANKLDTAKQDRLYAKNGAIASLRDAENLKEVKENERDKVKEDLVEVTRKAAEYFERVPVDAGETYHTLQLKFEKLQKDLQEAQRQYVILNVFEVLLLIRDLGWEDPKKI